MIIYKIMTNLHLILWNYLFYLFFFKRQNYKEFTFSLNLSSAVWLQIFVVQKFCIKPFSYVK